MAVIVNDMAEVGIDAEAVRGSGVNMHAAGQRVVELSNGCICCTLREDLLQVYLNTLGDNKSDSVALDRAAAGKAWKMHIISLL